MNLWRKLREWWYDWTAPIEDTIALQDDCPFTELYFTDRK